MELSLYPRNIRYDIFIRELTGNLSCNRQPSYAGIKHTYRCCIPVLHNNLLSPVTLIYICPASRAVLSVQPLAELLLLYYSASVLATSYWYSEIDFFIASASSISKSTYLPSLYPTTRFVLP